MAAGSGGRLAACVYAMNENDEVVWFTPDHDVPAWAAKQITNPRSWEVAPKGVKLDDEAGAPAYRADPTEPAKGDEEPPLGGPGSGVAAWKAHAEGLGIEVPDDAGRDDIVALVRDQQ